MARPRQPVPMASLPEASRTRRATAMAALGCPDVAASWPEAHLATSAQPASPAPPRSGGQTAPRSGTALSAEGAAPRRVDGATEPAGRHPGPRPGREPGQLTPRVSAVAEERCPSPPPAPSRDPSLVRDTDTQVTRRKAHTFIERSRAHGTRHRRTKTGTSDRSGRLHTFQTNRVSAESHRKGFGPRVGKGVVTVGSASWPIHDLG